MFKKLRYFIEFLALKFFYFLFSVMPVDRASELGGLIGRTVGPRLAASRKALYNMKKALPGRSEAFYKENIARMWDNLGRIIAEYPHLSEIAESRTEIINTPILEELSRDGLPAILFSGHLANWETAGGSFLKQCGFLVHLVYRPPNNPGSARLLDRARSLQGQIPTIPKSRAGARRMIEVLRDGQNIAILIDQKFNQGLPIPFFGHPAMTSPSFVQLARRFQCPLVPVRFERVKGAHFRITIFPPLDLEGPDGAPKPDHALITEAHTLLEGWITEKPWEWLWLHRRWSSAALERDPDPAAEEEDV